MKELIEKLKAHPLYAPVMQFARFGLVGVSNTAISYAVEMLGYYVLFAGSPLDERAKVVLVSALSFLVSTVNSYYWNNRFVFKGGQKSVAGHLAAYLRMAACYAVTGLALSPLIKLGLGKLGLPFWAASISTLIVTIPLNFILNKFWAFARKDS